MKRYAFAVLTLAALGRPFSVFAGTLHCPDTLDDDKHREVMATSAPEVKVRAALQGDSKRWMEVVRPLIQKAVKQAKSQRADVIQDGIEHACTLPQQYVGQILAVPDKPSGCDHRIVTRPGDKDQIWVQVVASCKYDWACCMPDNASASGTNAYTLEGSVSPNPPPPPPKK